MKSAASALPEHVAAVAACYWLLCTPKWQTPNSASCQLPDTWSVTVPLSIELFCLCCRRVESPQPTASPWTDWLSQCNNVAARRDAAMRFPRAYGFAVSLARHWRDALIWVCSFMFTSFVPTYIPYVYDRIQLIPILFALFIYFIKLMYLQFMHIQVKLNYQKLFTNDYVSGKWIVKLKTAWISHSPPLLVFVCFVSYAYPLWVYFFCRWCCCGHYRGYWLCGYWRIKGVVQGVTHMTVSIWLISDECVWQRESVNKCKYATLDLRSDINIIKLVTLLQF